MDAWSNEMVVAWLASKGFGVWTPFFKVREIDGKALAGLSLEELLEGKIDKSSAKKIILKRDRQLKKLQSFNNVTCYPIATKEDSSDYDVSPALVSRRPSALNDPDNSTSNIQPLNTYNPSYTSTSITNTLSQSSLLANPNLQSSPASLSPSNTPLGNSPISISPLGTSPETGNAMDIENGEKKKSKGKKKKKGKKGKKGKKLSTSTYNADDDASDSQTESELSDAPESEGVGTPYNVSHHLHVEYHADIGFTGLPPEWRARFEEGFSKERLSPYPLTWSTDNVALWLSNLGFGVYVMAFKKELVDGKRLVTFNNPEALRNVFPQVTEKHARAIHKQIEILKGSFPKSGKKPMKVFGVPLDSVMHAQRITFSDVEIPLVLHKLYSFIRERGLNHVGIFRIGPSVAQTQELRDKIDEAMDVDLSDFPDCIIPTSLIKLYFRELPHPIITHETYTSCMAALHKDISVMKQCLESMPLNNYTLLKHTLWLLHDVSRHKEINQMGSDNLAKVFGPTLLWQNTISGGVDGNALANVQMATAFVETCIASFPELFLSDAPILVPDEQDEGEASSLDEQPSTNGEDIELAKSAEESYELADDEADVEVLHEDSESTKQYGDSSSRVSSRLSEASGTSMETMVLHSSYDSYPDTSSQGSGSFASFNFAQNSASSLSSSGAGSTDSLVLDELVIPGPFKLSYSSDSSAPSTPTTLREKFKPPMPRDVHPFLPDSPSPTTERARPDSKEQPTALKQHGRNNSSGERERSQTLPMREHKRINSKDQSPPITERERSNSKEQVPAARDRSNSKENNPQERERSNSKEQAGPNQIPSSNGGPNPKPRERSDSKENAGSTRDRAATIDSLRGSPRASPRGPTLIASPRDLPPFRLSPRELRLRKDTLSVTPRESVVSIISPHSPRDPPTPRGVPSKHPLPVLLSPATLKPHTDDEHNPLSKSEPLIPPPHIWPLPASTMSSSTPTSPSFPFPLPPPPPAPNIPPSHAPPSPPPPPPPIPITQIKTRASDQKLLRRLTSFLPKDTKEKDKEKEEEKRKQKELDKERKREEKEQKEKEKEDKEDALGTKKLKKSGSLFMFGKKTKPDEKERSRTIFTVPPSPFSVAQPLKRSASVGVVGEKTNEKDHRIRSMSISSALID